MVIAKNISKLEDKPYEDMAPNEIHHILFGGSNRSIYDKNQIVSQRLGVLNVLKRQVEKYVKSSKQKRDAVNNGEVGPSDSNRKKNKTRKFPE